MRIIIIFLLSWFISAILLVPCLILSIKSGFTRDYHAEFHDWWGENVLDKIDQIWK